MITGCVTVFKVSPANVDVIIRCHSFSGWGTGIVYAYPNWFSCAEGRVMVTVIVRDSP